MIERPPRLPRVERRQRARVWLASAMVVVTAAALAVTMPTAAVAAPSTTRVSGSDRYTTAIAISQSGFPDGADTVYVATGEKFPDALTAAPAAAHENAPLLLTMSGTLLASLRSEIERLAPDRIVVVGGAPSVAENILDSFRTLAPEVVRIDGADRYLVSQNLARYAFESAEKAYIATGEDYPDALGASAAAGAQSAPVVLVRGHEKTVDPSVTALLRELEVTTTLVTGGTVTVSAGIGDGLRSAGFSAKRLAGADRYGASVAIAQYAFPTATTAYITSGVKFPDGLAGAAVAARAKAPLYLSQPDCVPDSVTADLGRIAPATVKVLGAAVTLDANVLSLTSCAALTAQKRTASEAALKSKIESRLPSLPGAYTVSVRRLDGLQETVHVRGSEPREPASSIKIFAAYAALKRIDQGTLSLSTKTSSGVSVGDCMRFMIHVSDNYCHTDLLRLLGNSNINNLLASEGYGGTHYVGNVGNQYFSSKTSSANDLTLFLMRLERGQVLSPSSTQHLLGLMKSQIWRSRIPSGIPAGVVQASKPGELWVSSGITQIDAGIVYSARGRYSLSVMGSNGATKASIAAISRIVYEHFNGGFGSAATFPVQQLSASTATTLRSGPNGSVIASIAPGTLVEAVTSSREWYRVVVNGRTGYVNALQLTNRY